MTARLPFSADFAGKNDVLILLVNRNTIKNIGGSEFADYFMDDSSTICWFLRLLTEGFIPMDLEKEIMDVIQCLLRFSKGLLPLKYVESELKMHSSKLTVTS
jgi:hypothetical protein